MRINTSRHSHPKHEQNVYHMTSYINKFITFYSLLFNVYLLLLFVWKQLMFNAIVFPLPIGYNCQYISWHWIWKSEQSSENWKHQTNYKCSYTEWLKKSLCAPDDYNAERYKQCSKCPPPVSRYYWHAKLCSQRPCSVQHSSHSQCILW
jgi:hypothetical protein